MEPKVRRRARVPSRGGPGGSPIQRCGAQPVLSLSKDTGTGYEVWYIRDEWARDHEVLHPHWGVLYKSGVYASKVTVLTPGGLPYAGTSRLRLIVRLREGQSTPIVWQESAEGIVDTFSFAGMDEALRPCPGNRRYDGRQL